MPSPEEMALADLVENYAGQDVSDKYLRLYPSDAPTSRIFASIHQRLNALLEFMNYKSGVNHHFNADESRELMALVDEIGECRATLTPIGLRFEFDGRYGRALDYCQTFLSPSGGSTIPDDFEKIKIIRYESVFRTADTELRIADRWKDVTLDRVGEGSFATVFRYTDPQYGIDFAIKRAKPNIGERNLLRFRKEFELLKQLRFPYVLEVYRFNADRNEYTMEYCHETLYRYIKSNPDRLTFEIRRRVALQFLYGLNYLHTKGHLHRDLSYNNILVKRYEGIAVVVKLADFGLSKERNSQLTRTESDIRGTIVDPTIGNFKDYNILNEVYSVGFILSFVFSGRTHITACTGEIRTIIDKCIAHDHAFRYPDLKTVIREVEQLPAPTPDGRGETPT